jgi:ADP-ribose pyrophosphatase
LKTIVHNNPWFAISHRADSSTPSAAGWYRVEQADSAIIIPIHENGDIVLVYGSRDTYGGKRFHEFPCGRVESGEATDAAARRELKEETGLSAGRLQKIGSFLEIPGLSSARCDVFVAKELTVSKQNLELSENWSVVTCPPQKVAEIISEGRMVDGSSIAAYALAVLNGFSLR